MFAWSSLASSTRLLVLAGCGAGRLLPTAASRSCPANTRSGWSCLPSGVGLDWTLGSPLPRTGSRRPAGHALPASPYRASTASGDRLTPSSCPSRSSTAWAVPSRAWVPSGLGCLAKRGLGQTSSTSTGPNPASMWASASARSWSRWWLRRVTTADPTRSAPSNSRPWTVRAASSLPPLQVAAVPLRRQQPPWRGGAVGELPRRAGTVVVVVDLCRQARDLADLHQHQPGQREHRGGAGQAHHGDREPGQQRAHPFLLLAALVAVWVGTGGEPGAVLPSSRRGALALPLPRPASGTSQVLHKAPASV